MYKRVKFNKNKSSVRCIDQLILETVHDITEIRRIKIDYLYFVFDLHMIAQG